MNPEDLMNGISNEIQSALKAMKKSKTAEEKLKHSEVIKNLCESLGVFLSLISSMPEYEDDDIPF